MHVLASQNPSDAAVNNAVGVFFLIVSALVAIAAYWIPTIIAYRRKLPERSQILVIDLLLGWTFIGWVVALVMALKPLPPQYQQPPWQAPQYPPPGPGQW
jgi:hypothetical protein